MNNLSNEHLDFIRKKAAGSADYVYRLKAREVESMASELLALREAGKEPVALGDIRRYTAANTQFGGIELKQDGVGDYVRYSDVLATAIAMPQLPAVPDGWVVVPTEATSAMLNAAWISHGIHHPSAWRTMIAAAPKPEPAVKK
ncbi:hypothetical protein F3J27_03600 [Enterobacter sp. Ap-916]|uniref:hypothetical protein n=1 Tax=unclassified Enterobacter TaxID=2608935 RepID=UPI00141F4D45|nr:MULTISPECIES: hypothetical protein [unclassified Enterobacter]NIF57488.1 hypothetical protein [Enterobacter sp. Ap-867]NIG28570.1 hypothetical protein [Enterobacter sp. Ap-916]